MCFGLMTWEVGALRVQELKVFEYVFGDVDNGHA